MLEASSAPHKYKIFTTANIIYQNTRSAALTISLAQLLKVKKDIGEKQEKVKAKNVSKPAKTILVVVPKPKAKRKLVVEETDSEKIPSPQLVRKPQTQKTKPVAPGSLPILSVIPSGMFQLLLPQWLLLLLFISQLFSVRPGYLIRLINMQLSNINATAEFNERFNINLTKQTYKYTGHLPGQIRSQHS